MGTVYLPHEDPWLWNFRKQLWFREMHRNTQHLRHRTRDVLSQPPKRHLLASSPSASCSGQCPKPSYLVCSSGKGVSRTWEGLEFVSGPCRFGAGGQGGDESCASTPLERINALATSNRNAISDNRSVIWLQSCLYCIHAFTKTRSIKSQRTDCGQALTAELVQGVR